MLMDQIYKEVIVSRSRRPRYRGTVEPHSVRQEGVNPSCGDELTLTFRVEDGVVQEAAFTGQGCAISQASADLMVEMITGRTLEEARDLSAAFKALMHGEDPGMDLGELRALEGVRKLHARVKCATLPFVTLDRALSEDAAGPESDRT